MSPINKSQQEQAGPSEKDTGEEGDKAIARFKGAVINPLKKFDVPLHEAEAPEGSLRSSVHSNYTVVSNMVDRIHNLPNADEVFGAVLDAITGRSKLTTHAEKELHNVMLDVRKWVDWLDSQK